MRGLWLSLSMFAAAGCGASNASERQCPDRPAHCLTGLDCAYDRTRRCEICQCAEPAYTPIEHDQPTGPPE